MISIMTFLITVVNLGFGPAFLAHWGKAFTVAYAVGVPTIFLLAPVARKLTGGILGIAPYLGATILHHGLKASQVKKLIAVLLLGLAAKMIWGLLA